MKVTGDHDEPHARPPQLLPLPAALLAAVDPELPGVVTDFYAGLARRPVLKEVLDRLTEDQFAALQRRQADHLRLLLSPDVDRDALDHRARQVGRVHAMSGIELDWYVEGVADHQRRINDAVARLCPELSGVEVSNALSARFVVDVHGAVCGYREIDESHHRLLIDVLALAEEATTVVDFSQGLVDALGRLPGVAVAMFARPDSSGRMEHEVGAGRGFAEFLAEAGRHDYSRIQIHDEATSGAGPIGRAWRSGRVERCDSLQTDPTTEPWHLLASRMGWGSSAALPLQDHDGATRALVSLQAAWTGYFAAPSRLALLEQVRRAAERTLADLEERATLSQGVQRFSERVTHLARLADGEVQMLFQPVVDLPSGRLEKLEGLARLHGPGRLIGPAEFLPAFGDGELFDLFEIGLRQSLEAMVGWEAKGLVTAVSVNLPVASVGDERYVRTVAMLVDEYDVEPGRLTLELLETGVVEREVQRTGRALQDFSDLGVRLAQDDLGSGYSSLLRLRNFAFDEVKIDQSLVRGTDLSPGAALHFIEPITDIAHSLGLHVVIEGLEHDGLIEAAVQLGVDAGQGYGIARPMPADEVLGWLSRFRLDLDPRLPRTPMGALAGHVAWERRLTSLGDHPLRQVILGIDMCVLTSYVDLLGPGRAELDRVHREVHAAAVDGRGSPEHRQSWERLAALLAG